MSEAKETDQEDEKNYAGFAALLVFAIIAALLFPTLLADGPPPAADEAVAEAVAAPVLAEREVQVAAVTPQAAAEGDVSPSLLSGDGEGDQAHVVGDGGAAQTGERAMPSDTQAISAEAAQIDEPDTIAGAANGADAPLVLEALNSLEAPESSSGQIAFVGREVFPTERPEAESSVGATPSVSVRAATDVPGERSLDAANIVSPSFDLIRVAPDGSAVVAGQAQPNVDVALLVDGIEVTRTTSGEDGAFVAFALLDPQVDPQVISLVATPDDAPTSSLDDLIVALPAQQEKTPSGPATEVETLPDVPIVLRTSQTGVDLVQPSVPLAALAQAPQVPTGDETRTTVDLESADQPLSIDTISYGTVGQVELTGRTAEDGTLRIYLDNKIIAETKVSEGKWDTELPAIDPGVYTLRVDRLDEDGTVASRVETPFKREAPSVLAEFVTAAPDFTLRVVQPGATLWAIARERYGAGIQYVKVFEANRERIKDPDLIYPGQVFEIPN